MAEYFDFLQLQETHVMLNLFLQPSQSIREGYLTKAEVIELQHIADKHQTVFYIVGSRAIGRGRNIHTQLPVGKGIHKRSDIDVRIDSQKDIETFGRLSNDIANASRGAGKSQPLIGKDATPPAIIFQPRTKPVTTLVNLSKGDRVYSIRFISNIMIRNWQFSHECEHNGGSFIGDTSFIISDIHRTPGNVWVKVIIPGSDPRRYLKISGEEYAHNFKHL